MFQDSLLFPLALTALGLGIVAAGIWWQRHEHEFRTRFRALLPDGLRMALETAG